MSRADAVDAAIERLLTDWREGRIGMGEVIARLGRAADVAAQASLDGACDVADPASTKPRKPR